jgi:hypothetical protein
MCLAPEGLAVSETRAKALLLLTTQLDRWRSALAIYSHGKRKTDIEVFRAYLTSRGSSSRNRGYQPLPRQGR